MTIVPLLAGNVPQPDQWMFLQVILSLAALISIAGNIKKLLPEKRKPPIEAEFVSRSEFKEFLSEIRAEMSEIKREQTNTCDKIEQGNREMLLAGERRAKDIHVRINEIDRMVAGLNAITERTK